MKIVRSTVGQIFADPRFGSLAREYREQAGNTALTGEPDREKYLMLEELGALGISSAISDTGELIGFLVVIFAPSLHNGKTVATVDTLFIRKEHRKGPAGLRLIREAQRLAEEHGCAGIRYSAPAGSRLETLFERMFERTDVSFYLSLEK